MWWEDRWPRNFLPWLISWDLLGVLSCKQNRLYLVRYCNKTCNVKRLNLEKYTIQLFLHPTTFSMKVILASHQSYFLKKEHLCSTTELTKLFFLQAVHFYNHPHFNNILIITGDSYYCSHQLHNTTLQSVISMATPQVRWLSHWLLTSLGFNWYEWIWTVMVWNIHEQMIWWFQSQCYTSDCSICNHTITLTSTSCIWIISWRQSSHLYVFLMFGWPRIPVHSCK